MGNVVTPSSSPANSGSFPGMFRQLFRKLLMDYDNKLPAVVIEYDRTANMAQVQVVIDMVMTSGDVQPRAPIASVPVLALGGGGFCITFPLAAGDLGWICASDRDISLFMQSLAESRPPTFRLHSFEDGLFIPDSFHQHTYDPANDGCMVIQSYDGTITASFGNGQINLNAVGGVFANGTQIG